MNEPEARSLIAAGETLTVEFKSDRGPFGDSELVEAVVCLTNHLGGMLLIGVENNGQVTGLNTGRSTHPDRLAGLIAGRTEPPVSVGVEVVDLPDGRIAVIEVPQSNQLSATKDGKTVIRCIGGDGKPSCRPLYPHEYVNWRAERGQADFSAMSLQETSWDDLDPLEFVRLRRVIEENHGDAALLHLDDVAIARALGLVKEENGRRTPTVAGLLLVGKELSLREHLPTHEVAFQVLRGLDVTMDEFRRTPLLQVQEWLMQAVDVRNEEQELMAGGVRVGVPKYDRRGLREAIHNALIHRDYTRRAAIYIQLRDDEAIISSPGGFVQGITPDSLLTASPHPRNPLLADIFKRVGLVERTGRGVRLIYQGQLQNGRRPPDYSRSRLDSVSLVLENRPADLGFIQAALRANRALGRALRMEELAALWLGWKEKSVPVEELAHLIQTDPAVPLGQLADAGLTRTGGGVYRLTTQARAGEEETREGAQSAEEQILTFIREHGRIDRAQAAQLLDLNEDQAFYRLKKLIDQAKLRLIGKGRGSYYELTEKK
ncbi:MAG: ATP-binding protein [Anaerolineaceae bacterium]|nr:ATP-binding protein [Anaerolineaceae bacterium]